MSTQENQKTRPVAKPTVVLACILALGAPIAGAPAGASEESPDAAPSAAAHMEIAFKLDPRITKGLYMGDRWVSPPTYTRTAQGSSVTVDAKVDCRDARGIPASESIESRASDPDMVTVSQPVSPNQLEISIHRLGTSTLELSCGPVSKSLVIAANPRGEDGMLVEITR
jgi:hypothetical protein